MPQIDDDVIVCIRRKYSAKARPNYGYHDYITTVEGNVGKLLEYAEAERRRLKEMSMWCRMSDFEQVGIVTGRYVIEHGYDSGD